MENYIFFPAIANFIYKINPNIFIVRIYLSSTFINR